MHAISQPGLRSIALGMRFVTGTTRAVSPFQTTGGQAWVMKLNPSGSALLYNRNIGGNTQGNGVAVDSQGNAYVAGTSFTADFPAVNALQAHAPASSLLATHDGGATWTSLNNNLGAVTVNALAIDPTKPATLYAATSGGFYKSLDAERKLDAPASGSRERFAGGRRP